MGRGRRMKVLQFDRQFIKEHIDEFVQLEDYVPEVPFIVYDKQNERDEFLKSKNLLTTIREMDQILDEKCKHSKNPVRSRDIIIIEWLDCHPEFEEIIAKESLEHYQHMKAIYEEFTFINLLYRIEVPSEKKSEPLFKYREDVSFKDDSHSRFPDFKKKDKIYEQYGSSLLAMYLSYFV